MSVENQEPAHEKNRLEEIKDIIKDASGSTEEEFLSTPNSWLACFTSSAFVVETYFNSSKVKNLISSDEYNRADERIEELKTRLVELKELYPSKEDIPPEDIKQELFSKLDIFR